MQKNILKTFFLLAIFLIMPESVFAEDPLIYANNLEYQGAFRVPRVSGANNLSYGGSVITYNADNDSLFIVGHDQQQTVRQITKH